MLILLANVILTAAMFGVIWIVQLVHYPMFLGLRQDRFEEWHEFHSRRITFVVLPLMIAELFVALWLGLVFKNISSWIPAAFTIVLWAATFFLSVPIHNQLGQAHQMARGQVEAHLRKLVLTNWVRTGIYSLKMAWLIFLVVSSVS